MYICTYKKRDARMRRYNQKKRTRKVNVICPEGHLFSYYNNTVVNKGGLYLVWCEDCQIRYDVSDLKEE